MDKAGTKFLPVNWTLPRSHQSQSQAQNCQGRKAWARAQLPKAVTQVLNESCKTLPPRAARHCCSICVSPPMARMAERRASSADMPFALFSLICCSRCTRSSSFISPFALSRWKEKREGVEPLFDVQRGFLSRLPNHPATYIYLFGHAAAFRCPLSNRRYVEQSTIRGTARKTELHVSNTGFDRTGNDNAPLAFGQASTTWRSPEHRPHSL